MEINIESFIGQSNHDYGSLKIELYGYACRIVNYSGKLTDHDAYEWVDCNTPRKLDQRLG